VCPRFTAWANSKPGGTETSKILRVDDDVLNGALQALDVAADNPHLNPVFQHGHRDLGRLYIPVARIQHLLRRGEVGPGWNPPIRPLGSPFGISWWMMPPPAAIHWTSPGWITPLVPSEIVQHEKRVEQGDLVEPEGPPQVHAGAFDRG